MGVGVALAATGAGSDSGVGGVVGEDSVEVVSVCQYVDTGSVLGPAGSPSVVVITTVRCSGVGCGAGSGSALGGTGSEGGGSVSVEGVSTGGVVLTGGAVGVVAGSATCFPLTIVVLSPVSGC